MRRGWARAVSGHARARQVGRALVVVAVARAPAYAQRPRNDAIVRECGVGTVEREIGATDVLGGEIVAFAAIDGCRVSPDSTEGTAAPPAPLTVARPAGAQRSTRDARRASAARDGVPRLPGGPLTGCSVGRAAVFGAALGIGMSAFAWSFLGSTTRQHLAWSAAMTVTMAGVTMFLEQVACG